MAKPWQRGSVSTQQENCFDEVAPRLLDGKRAKRTIINRTLSHNAINRQRQLFFNLQTVHIWDGSITPAFIIEPPVGILNCALATFNSNVH